MRRHLPAEVWRLIFNHAIRDLDCEGLKTEWDYDPDDRLWNAWTPACRTDSDDQEMPTVQIKSRNQMCQSIIRVCRQWYSIGVEFVYEIIELVGWYTDQVLNMLVTAFQRSSNSDPEGRGYGWWTRRINVDIDLLARKGSLEHVLKLLSHCHNLTIFVCRGLRRTGLRISAKTHQRVVQLIETRFTHSLRRFEWPNSTTLQMVGSSTAVPAICLSSLDIMTEDLPPRIVRDSVTTLTLRPPYGLWIKVLSPDWHFPCLRHLAFADIGERDVSPLVTFVQRHANHLQSLALRSRYDRNTICVGIPNLIRAATRLNTLVIRDVDMSMLSASDYGSVSHIGIVDIVLPYKELDRTGTLWALTQGFLPTVTCIHLLDRVDETYGPVLDGCKVLGVAVRRMGEGG